MYQRDPRSYPYEEQHTAYPSSHTPSHSGEYPASSYQPHDSSHYYVAPAHGINNPSDSTHSSSPYYRSMTPSLATHRYPNSSRSSDPRYHSSHGYGSSTSSASLSMYGTQPHQYSGQYIPTSDQRSHPLSHTPPSQFIPTPSEMAHSYSNYSQQSPHSPTVPEAQYSSSALDYPVSPQLTPSSRTNPHLPSRIVTGRPRTMSAATSTSPTSASSPPGERFPCEKCGKTFSRSHDRKRHNETQHTAMPIMHTCQFCQKEFSRADSLKRHLDNGCDMHS
ncbi:hypothetical protein M413DRAFT_442002 [Hebeloma cylindrosporum]|uniref:C2H2-type domain-containing protein n=1 Tax=Hebeloma cylindrosporum TaxID=76867 RepID=A0A0C3C8Y8_HEBCY|nr:hypothetical protein M413DRAFT_442002 [Hebeloma cylindrosporum h7]